MKRIQTQVLAWGLAGITALATTSLARPISTVRSDTDYRQLVTKRQVVDLLLAQAAEALKAPARASTPGFTGKLPSNMEILAEKLEQAAELEPYRADLLFSAASARISTRHFERAIAHYDKILEIAPDDVDARSYLAAWQRCLGDKTASDRHLTALKEVHAGRAQDLERVFGVIDSVTAMPVKDALSQEEVKALKGPVAIVALGYVLNPDGSMNDILVQRLHKTLDLAKQLPDALIVVTGGVPHANNTEGKLMAQWLAEHGVERSRIAEDNFARTTVENALFARYALAKHRIQHAVLVSSGSHVRRAQALFTIASWETGPRDLTYISVAAPDKPLPELQKVSDSELRGIYRDALKTMGLWSFRSYPLEER